MNSPRKPYQGNILLYALIVVGIIGLISAWSMKSTSVSVQTSQKTFEMQANTANDQGTTIRDAFSLMQTNNNVSPNSIYISTPAGTIANATPGAAGNTIVAGTGINTGGWLYDTTNGGTSWRQNIQTEVQANPITATTPNPSGWIIKTTADATTALGAPVVKLKGVGADANADYVAVAYDIKLGVCQYINLKAGRGNATDNPPTSTGYSLAAWQTPSTPIDLSAGFPTGAGIANLNGSEHGCFVTTDGKYVAYAVLQGY